ncbi:hypothetical protein FOMPIDRAFT_1060246 [Fomitopsis schrenkii]|uniref:Actin-like ATPase domain-containing protein n=1 Tax=Fomitopsis schrenkii TaxID=2126942 RepID=S8E6U2_FOMSC|nr:hypothetical protein FOMPIDRAFT_1060246 [Fomitopsis schrenkii]
MTTPQPYKGSGRKLVIAIDIGTTYSGAAYCVLDPGEIPKVLSVIRFPGQEGENKSRDVKIPSVLYYDRRGVIRAAGAEATLQDTMEEAYGEEWTYVKWFKLHLRPSSILPGAALPPIPVNKTPVEIMADFLAYIFKCTKDFISETNPTGRQILEMPSLKLFGPPIDFVLSHPNGWTGPQQNNMRRAAVLAKLIPDGDQGASRLQFVTEGEASLQFCVSTGLGDNVITEGNHVTIVDCGGGTIDVSTYRVVDSQPVSVEESTIPDCLIQGSTMVNHRAEGFLRNKLRSSRFATNEDIDTMISTFDSTTKPTFRDASKKSYIKFSGPRDTDETYDIRRGVLSLSGSEMGSFFQPSIDAIKSAIDRQIAGSNPRHATILLVGGFATSPFLRAQLQAHVHTLGLRIFTPEGQTSKAVAEGALWFYLDHRVRARVARHTYGSDCTVNYNASKESHRKRKLSADIDLGGSLVLPSSFAVLTRKGTSVTETAEFQCAFGWKTASVIDKPVIYTDIIAYRGDKVNPEWMDEEPEMYTTLCTVRCTPAASSWQAAVGPKGSYRRQDFQVILQLGLTEMKAQVGWEEDGVQRR